MIWSCFFKLLWEPGGPVGQGILGFWRVKVFPWLPIFFFLSTIINLLGGHRQYGFFGQEMS